MPVIFKNPKLPDYFLEVPEVRADTPPRDIQPIIQPFEAGKVISLPNLRFGINHAFWANLPTDDYPKLKKLTSRPPVGPGADDLLNERLRTSGAPADLQAALKTHIASLYAQALPIYEALFAGYRFTRRHAVWRLNTIMSENMHVDTSPEAIPSLFARMFINLDAQPRIWTTSWPLEQMYRRFADQVDPAIAKSADPLQFRDCVSRTAFGETSKVWWHDQPRHVAYFQPGDVWIVDSWQVAHQIFYGRRAVSIDFFVDPESMDRPGRHYIRMARRLKRKVLGAAAAGDSTEA